MVIKLGVFGHLRSKKFVPLLHNTLPSVSFSKLKILISSPFFFASMAVTILSWKLKLSLLLLFFSSVSICFIIFYYHSCSFRFQQRAHINFPCFTVIDQAHLHHLPSSSSSSLLHPLHTVCLAVPTVSVAASRAIVTSSDVQATVQHWRRWPAPPVPSVLLSTKLAEFSPIRCLLLLLCGAKQASAISSFQAQGELLHSLILVLVYRTKRVSV